MFPSSDPRGRNQPRIDSESGDDPMLRTSGKWSNTLCSSRQCDLLIIPKNRTFGADLNFSGWRVYQELSRINRPVISSVSNSALTTVCIGPSKVRA